MAKQLQRFTPYGIINCVEMIFAKGRDDGPGFVCLKEASGIGSGLFWEKESGSSPFQEDPLCPPPFQVGGGIIPCSAAERGWTDLTRLPVKARQLPSAIGFYTWSCLKFRRPY